MILRFVLAADVATVALACLVFAAFGWVLGYGHRGLVEWGRRLGVVARHEFGRWRRLRRLKPKRRNWLGAWS